MFIAMTTTSPFLNVHGLGPMITEKLAHILSME